MDGQAPVASGTGTRGSGLLPALLRGSPVPPFRFASELGIGARRSRSGSSAGSFWPLPPPPFWPLPAMLGAPSLAFGALGGPVFRSCLSSWQILIVWGRVAAVPRRHRPSEGPRPVARRTETRSPGVLFRPKRSDYRIGIRLKGARGSSCRRSRRSGAPVCRLSATVPPRNAPFLPGSETRTDSTLAGAVRRGGRCGWMRTVTDPGCAGCPAQGAVCRL